MRTSYDDAVVIPAACWLCDLLLVSSASFLSVFAVPLSRVSVRLSCVFFCCVLLVKFIVLILG